MAVNQDTVELEKHYSSESEVKFELDDSDFETRHLTSNSHNPQRSSHFQSILDLLPPRSTKFLTRRRLWRKVRRRLGRNLLACPTVLGRRTRLAFSSVAGFIIVLITLTAIFRPSYTDPPAHYKSLRKRILASNDYGRGNNDNQKIFIAASISDKKGHLVNGAWGRSVLELLNILGNRNTFLSIYENDGGEQAQEALEEFEKKVQCNSALVYEEHMSLGNISNVTLPDGSERTKRIAYLAEVRNKALKPLEDSDISYDKVLFLNDVIFDPIDAAQLLFSTNANDHGKASYHAACAVDFINPFKFYDTFATRDFEGYSMGVPFFPWFSDAGEGLSRQDVLDGKDAVRVKSCWGGMVAFDAKFLQAPTPQSAVETVEERNILNSDEEDKEDEMGEVLPESKQWGLDQPIRFRSEPDLYWEASECCLIHADLIEASREETLQGYTGIYQNPFVRVAYDSWTLWWLRLTRRFERLYTIPHTVIDHLVGLPWPNPRREAKKDAVGADVGGYCGIQTLQLLRETPQSGEKYWETVHVSSA